MLQHNPSHRSAAAYPTTPSPQRQSIANSAQDRVLGWNDAIFKWNDRHGLAPTPPLSPEKVAQSSSASSVPEHPFQMPSPSVSASPTVFRPCSSCGLRRRSSVFNSDEILLNQDQSSPWSSASVAVTSPKPRPRFRRLSEQCLDKFCPDTIMPPPPSSMPRSPSSGSPGSSNYALHPGALAAASMIDRRRHHRRRRSSLCHVENLIDLSSVDEPNQSLTRAGYLGKEGGVKSSFRRTSTSSSTSTTQGFQEDVLMDDKHEADRIAQKLVEKSKTKISGDDYRRANKRSSAIESESENESRSRSSTRSRKRSASPLRSHVERCTQQVR